MAAAWAAAVDEALSHRNGVLVVPLSTMDAAARAVVKSDDTCDVLNLTCAQLLPHGLRGLLNSGEPGPVGKQVRMGAV
jgi:hypothetical protein